MKSLEYARYWPTKDLDDKASWFSGNFAICTFTSLRFWQKNLYFNFLMHASTIFLSISPETLTHYRFPTCIFQSPPDFNYKIFKIWRKSGSKMLKTSRIWYNNAITYIISPKTKQWRKGERNEKLKKWKENEKTEYDLSNGKEKTGRKLFWKLFARIIRKLAYSYSTFVYVL